MFDFLNVILIVCLIGCGVYIYWLHYQQKMKKLNQSKKEKSKQVEDHDDEPSFLKSDYDGKSEGDSLFDEDNNSMLNE